jgi:hypothetical protein
VAKALATLPLNQSQTDDNHHFLKKHLQKETSRHRTQKAGQSNVELSRNDAIPPQGINCSQKTNKILNDCHKKQLKLERAPVPFASNSLLDKAVSHETARCNSKNEEKNLRWKIVSQVDFRGNSAITLITHIRIRADH